MSESSKVNNFFGFSIFKLCKNLYLPTFPQKCLPLYISLKIGLVYSERPLNSDTFLAHCSVGHYSFSGPLHYFSCRSLIYIYILYSSSMPLCYFLWITTCYCWCDHSVFIFWATILCFLFLATIQCTPILLCC